MCWNEAKPMEYPMCGHTEVLTSPCPVRCEVARLPYCDPMERQSIKYSEAARQRYEASVPPLCEPLETRTGPSRRETLTPCWKCMHTREWMRFVFVNEWHHKDSPLCMKMVASGRQIAPLPPDPFAPIAPPQPPTAATRTYGGPATPSHANAPMAPPQPPTAATRTYGGPVTPSHSHANAPIAPPQPPTAATRTSAGPATPSHANAPALRSTQQLRRLQPHDPGYVPELEESLRARAKLRQAVTSAMHTLFGLKAVTSAIHTQSRLAETSEIVASVQTLAQRQNFEGLRSEFCRRIQHQGSGVLPPDAHQRFELWYRTHRVRLQSQIAQLDQVMTQVGTTSLLRAIKQAAAGIHADPDECLLTVVERAIFNILDAPGGFLTSRSQNQWAAISWRRVVDSRRAARVGIEASLPPRAPTAPAATPVRPQSTGTATATSPATMSTIQSTDMARARESAARPGIAPDPGRAAKPGTTTSPERASRATSPAILAVISAGNGREARQSSESSESSKSSDESGVFDGYVTSDEADAVYLNAGVNTWNTWAQSSVLDNYGADYGWGFAPHRN